MKKRILSCFMALALCLTLLPATAQAADTHAEQQHCLCGMSGCNGEGHGTENTLVTFNQWLGSSQTGGKLQLLVGGPNNTGGTPQDTQDNKFVLTGGNYYLKTRTAEETFLDGDVTIKYPIVIRGDVTICLNGQTIQSKGGGMPVFEVQSDATLTLTDCQNNKGKVTHASDGSGCGVKVESGGTFNMYGGKITGNTTNTYGGGVYVYGGNSKFNMYGGTITDNTATKGGGGVYVSGGTFTMNGGASSVSKNTAKNGGGVSVSSGTFNMNDGKISGNTGNGVFVHDNATFTVSNTPTVTGNTITKNGAASNVFLTWGAKITIGTGGLNCDDGSIGVTKGAGRAGDAIATGANKDYSGKFFVDDNKYKVGYDETHKQLVLAEKDTSAETHTHCLCGKTHTAIGDHKTDTQITFDTKLWMDNGVLKKGNGDWTKGTVNRADGGAVSHEGYVLTTGSYYLDDNLTLNGAAILIDGDVKLCLNGHTIDRANGNAALDYVIWVLGENNAHLTLTDCVGGGTIKGGGNGGVDIFGFCTLDMFGGTITGNTNSGVNVGQFGEFNMYSGKITGNSAGFGGGVYTYGKFTMSGGSITNNTATEKGGGVLVGGGTFTVSGNVNITNNKVNNERNNVYLSKANKTVIGVAGALSGGARIGVTPETWPVGNGQVAIASGESTATGGTHYDMTRVDMNCFQSDNGEYQTSLANNTVLLAKKGGTTPAGKPDPKYTPPTAKTGLVYNGTAQVLINKGSVEGGIMQYRLDNGAYSPDLPTATNAGIYTVWYKVVGDATHNDVAEQSLKVWIEKALLSGTPTFTKVTEAGKTLKDVTFTKADGWPEGKFEWGNGVLGYLEDKPLVQGKAYSWLYLADNYYAKGSVVLWADPSSGGGSTGSGGSSSDRDSSDSNPIIKTETKNHADGSTTKTETRRDGSVTQTTTGKDGSVSKTETKPDGSSVTENKAADGSTGTVKTDKNGQTEAAAKVSGKAVEDAKKNGEAVKAPVEVEASRNSSTAPTVKVELPKNSGETKVEIPVSNVKSGTVAVLVHPDGTEEILKNSIPTEDGIQLTVDGNATVKIVDNSKGFIDTRNHWAEDAIDFVSARGLVNGMSDTIYAPNNSTTRAQLWTILARQNDADLTGGSVWYEKAQNWAKDKGVSDGANPNAAINRAQMVTMLWRAVGQPAPATAATFTDVSADAYYADAVSWAVENGITTGIGNGRFDPTGACTRAQIAAFLTRLYAEK